MHTRLPRNAALVLVDPQRAFDEARWGPRNNPHADNNISALLTGFSATRRPIALVRHAAASPTSSLHPSHPGHAYRDCIDASLADVEIVKSVNSSFHGEPDLHSWLQLRGITTVVIAGITTNHCCETTARVAGNLGYDVWFALDATFTFDRTGPDGTVLTADELAQASATNLHGEFATVAPTSALLWLLRHHDAGQWAGGRPGSDIPGG